MKIEFAVKIFTQQIFNARHVLQNYKDHSSY